MKRDGGTVPITRRSLYHWVFSTRIRLQVVLLLIILITVAARVLPLEMQKKIVNEAISMKKTDLLYHYCAIYLAAVLTATGLKYLINALQAVIGQRALADMRKALFHHIVTLPLGFFRRTQPGMVINSLVNELAAAGEFVGMAIAVPVTNLLTLLAFGGYLFWLNPLLAAVSLSIYPLVLILIPRLQRRVNIANRKRLEITASLSDRIGESVSGIHEIHGNGAFAIENRKIDAFVEELRKIRVIWNLYKYGVKVANNLFNNLSPFLIFILGGWLAIHGRLELGALVAFLSAQEKLYDPWRELIDFYQAYQDATVRYQRVMSSFDIFPDYQITPSGRRPFSLEGDIHVENLTFRAENGTRLLENISFSLRPGEHLAVVGFSGSGKSTLALCIAQLIPYSTGHLRLGDHEVADLTKADIAANIGLVSQSPFIFDGTIEENLTYARLAVNEDDADNGVRKLKLSQPKHPTLDDMISVLQKTGLFPDLLRLGLSMVIDRDGTGASPEDHPAEDDLPGLFPGLFIDKLIRIRKRFRTDHGEDLAEYVEFFDEDRYLLHSDIADNIIFGTALDPAFESGKLCRNDYFLSFLNAADLTRPLISLGVELVKETVEILSVLPREEVFFEQSTIRSNEFDKYKALSESIRHRKIHQLSKKERGMLLDIALRFAPGRHKMAGLPKMLQNLILEARAMFRERIATDRPDAFTFYQWDRYIHGQSILNNILFGNVKSRETHALETIRHTAIQLLIEEDLLEEVLKIGMQFPVGNKGDKLSGGQRQKLAIARVLLKNPRIIILDEATSALDNASQSRIQRLLENEWRGRSTVISVVHRLDIVKNVDRIAVMKNGKIHEIGSYEELIRKKGIFYELAHGEA